jgi:demethylmenaquinone methyltransferase/2-methoxy-6-polyprenyl-1,4-benzoquinol methylase
LNESDRELIEEQIRYYDRRAPEYDATATPEGDPLASQGRQLAEALDRFRPEGTVLEIACGTGSWTAKIARHAAELTALDSSPAMLELNRQKVGDETIRYVTSDVFKWEPDRLYDAVVFANWLSHVPPDRFEEFWMLVAKCLVPGGRVFFVDEVFDAWRHEEQLSEEFLDAAVPLVRRTLRDGTSYRVVKVFWNPHELEARLRALDWEIEVSSTGAFCWGEGRRRAGSEH